MGQKSIIGCGYVPRGARAMCLKTKTEANLGIHTYQIISDPYEGELVKRVRTPLALLEEYHETRYKAMVVNILDPQTGLTYAVAYHPANLVRKDAESPQAATSESSKMDSAAYIKQIRSFTQALDQIAKDNPDVENDCGILLIYNRINEDGKTYTGGRLFGGNFRALQFGLKKLFSDNSQFRFLLAKLIENAAMKRAHDVLMKLDGIVCSERDE